MSRFYDFFRTCAKLCLLLVASNLALAKGSLFTYSTEGAVHLRWNAPLGQSYGGFFVERQAMGGSWERLNKEPIERIQEVAEIRRLLGYNAEAYLTFFEPGTKSIDDAQLARVAQDEIALSLIQLFSVKFPQFGKVLGEIYSDRDLQTDTQFNYRIIGEIDGQTVTWAHTLTPVPHGKADRVALPKGLMGEGIDSTALLTWEHDIKLSRSGERIGYRVYRAANPSGPFELDSFETVIPTLIDKKLPDFLYADDFLTNGTPYWFKITGVNLLGYESAYTQAIKIVPRDEVPPKPPRGFKGRLQVESSLLRWEPSTEPDLEGYRLYRSEEASGPYEQVWPAEEEPLSPMISHVDKDVPEGSILWYQVTAIDQSGNESNPSDTIQIFREDITPPAPVQGVKAAAITEGEEKDKGIHLSWDANTEADLQGYLVERTTRVEGKGDEAKVTTEFYVETPKALQETRYVDPIPEGSESRYAYRVIAVDEIFNRSEPSEVVIAQMPDIVPPTRPVLSYARLENDKVHIAWSANAEDDLAGYNLLRSKQGTEFAIINGDMIEPRVNEYFDRPTEFDQVFRYQLVAVDDTGNVSEPSAILSVKVIDLVGPDAPAIVRIDVEEQGLHVFWNTERSEEITMLVLYRVEEEQGSATIMGYLEPDTEYFIDTDVVEEESYTYYLRATDKLRNLGKPGKSAARIFKPAQKNE